MRHEWNLGGKEYSLDGHMLYVERMEPDTDEECVLILADEVHRLAPQALEAALYRSILEAEAGVAGTVDGLRKVIEERDHAQVGLAEATEIAAELTVAWAAAVGEGVIPCTEDCGTKGHLGTAASAACRKALDRWREMEERLAEQAAEIERLRAESTHLPAEVAE